MSGIGPGDVVEKYRGPCTVMPRGTVCRVVAVGRGRSAIYGPCEYFVLEGHDPGPGLKGWSAPNFRKLDNDTGFDFREQLRAKPRQIEPTNTSCAPYGAGSARAVPIPSGSGGHPSTPETVA